MKRSLTSHAGFTLLEIMLVVMIIAMLAGLAINQMGGQVNIAGETRARSDFNTIKTQLMIYQAQNGFLPTTEQGLKALVTMPDGEPRPRNWRKLLPEVPQDAWQNNYFYEQPGKHNTDSYDLFSAGPNRKPGDDDDIGNWKKG